jgi:hypothetical protein
MLTPGTFDCDKTAPTYSEPKFIFVELTVPWEAALRHSDGERARRSLLVARCLAVPWVPKHMGKAQRRPTGGLRVHVCAVMID